MAAHEVTVFRQSCGIAVHEKRGLGKFLRAQTRVVREGPDTTVHIESRVFGRRAVAGGDLVELVTVLVEYRGHSLENGRALGECHLPECRAALVATVREHGGEIDAFAPELGNFFSGDGVPENPRPPGANFPLPRSIALQRDHLGILSKVDAL